MEALQCLQSHRVRIENAVGLFKRVRQLRGTEAKSPAGSLEERSCLGRPSDDANHAAHSELPDPHRGERKELLRARMKREKTRDIVDEIETGTKPLHVRSEADLLRDQLLLGHVPRHREVETVLAWIHTVFDHAEGLIDGP